MDPNFLKKLNVPPSELGKILKMLQKNEPQAKQTTIFAPDIFRFFLIRSKQDLEIYRINPADPTLASFGPFCSDFLMEDEDEAEQFGVEGYEHLCIHFLIDPRTMHFCFKHDFKVAGKPSMSVADILKRVFEDFPELNKPGVTSLDEFAKCLEQPSLRQSISSIKDGECGDLVQFERTDTSLECVSGDRVVEIPSATQMETAVLGYQFFLRFFIDAGTKIDVKDPNWTFWFAFQDQNIAGFLSAYYFHLSSFEFKLRISQVIVLPSFRGKRFGQSLVGKVYSRYLADERCTKVTVEDPNDSFTHIQFRLWVDLLSPVLRSHPELAAVEVAGSLKAFSLKGIKKLVGEKVKCSPTNADTLVDLFLLHKAHRDGKADGFREYLTAKVQAKRDEEKQARQAKMERKFIVFDQKRVSGAKISKLYEEMEEEERPAEVGLIVQNLLDFLEKLLPFFGHK